MAPATAGAIFVYGLLLRCSASASGSSRLFLGLVLQERQLKAPHLALQPPRGAYVRRILDLGSTASLSRSIRDVTEGVES
jgi:hypothetical protein